MKIKQNKTFKLENIEKFHLVNKPSNEKYNLLQEKNFNLEENLLEIFNIFTLLFELWEVVNEEENKEKVVKKHKNIEK